jgi:hypothetical protein
VAEVKEKLQGKAKGTGLFGSDGASTAPSDLTSSGVYKVSHSAVWMVAR